MAMRVFTGYLCAALLAAGCAAQHSPAPFSAQPAADKSKTIITPDYRPAGQVAMVNKEARFVILSFAVGPLPEPGRRLRIDHRGLKIGVVKVTGPRQDNNTVAELVEGESNAGDDARAE
jgi:hypothetical protein